MTIPQTNQIYKVMRNYLQGYHCSSAPISRLELGSNFVATGVDELILVLDKAVFDRGDLMIPAWSFRLQKKVWFVLVESDWANGCFVQLQSEAP